MFAYLKAVKQNISIRYKYRKQLRLLKDVFKLNRDIMKTGNGLCWDENDYFSKVTIIFIVKNIHRLKSILILCQKGLAKDTLSLLRTIFEELVDYKYMFENKKSVKEYSDYDTYLKLKIAKELERYKNKPYIKNDLLEDQISYLQKEWNKVKNSFEIKQGDKIYICKRWNKENLRDTSRLIGLEEVYIYLYKYLSFFTHSTTISAENYLLGRDSRKNSIVFEVGSSEGFIDEVCLTASSLALEFLKISNSRYDLKIIEKIKKIEHRMKDIKNKNYD